MKVLHGLTTRREILRVHRDEMIGALFLLFFFVGAVGHHLQTTLPLMLIITPYFLMVFGAVALFPVVREGGLPFLAWAAGTYILTFIAEAAGVATGAIFGSYEYGTTLGIKMLEVPLVIGFNWVIVLTGAARLCSGLHRRARRLALGAGAPAFVAALTAGTAAATAAALVGVGFDVILEPVAMQFDYWSWAGNSVPASNYAAWFVVGLVPLLVYFTAGLQTKTRIPAYYLLVQTVFFVSLLPLSL